MKHSRKSAQMNYRHSLVTALSQILYAPLLRPIRSAFVGRVAGSLCFWFGRPC